MNPASPDELERRGYTGPASPIVQQTRLDEAWRALEDEIPSVPDRLNSGELAIDRVIDVLCAAALRVLRNPEGVRQESGAIDDYTESRSFADASADLYFTAAEKARLRPRQQSGGQFTGSLRYC